jgi:hypothetical protein
MFEDLDQRMRRDQDTDIPPRQRMMRNGLVLLVSLVLFGALYAVFRFAEA